MRQRPINSPDRLNNFYLQKLWSKNYSSARPNIENFQDVPVECLTFLLDSILCKFQDLETFFCGRERFPTAMDLNFNNSSSFVDEYEDCSACNNSLCWSEEDFQQYLYYTQVNHTSNSSENCEIRKHKDFHMISVCRSIFLKA